MGSLHLLKVERADGTELRIFNGDVPPQPPLGVIRPSIAGDVFAWALGLGIAAGLGFLFGLTL